MTETSDPKNISTETLTLELENSLLFQDLTLAEYLQAKFMLFGCLMQVLGSAGVIGNPMGFARNVGFGLKDFISASRKGKLQVCKYEVLAGMSIL